MKVLNITDKKLDEIINILLPAFKPTQIFLFGSRSRGEAREDSDYDIFFIVKNSTLTPIRRMQRASTLLWGIGVKVDVFIYTEQEYMDWKDEFSSIPHTIATEGLELRVG